MHRLLYEKVEQSFLYVEKSPIIPPFKEMIINYVSYSSRYIYLNYQNILTFCILFFILVYKVSVIRNVFPLNGK